MPVRVHIETPMSDLHAKCREAQRIARAAGTILLRYFERIEHIELKGFGNPVTEADKASEAFIRAEFVSLYPDIPMFGEETGFGGNADALPFERCWVVDPLDGTVNYAARIPLFVVSIGYMEQGIPLIGVIYDPNRDEMFHAIRGVGAFRNDKPIRVSDRSPLDGLSPVAISADVIRLRPQFLAQLHKGRVLGAAALHLAYISAGIIDACLDPKTRLWDVAAGAVLVEEGGGRISYWDGKPIFPVQAGDPAWLSGPVAFLATNGARHEEMVGLAGKEMPSGL